MSQLFGQPLYAEGDNNTEFFLERLVESLPPAYRPPETEDFLRRFLLPSAEDLAYVNRVFDLLDTYVYPESAPEEWVRWMLTEWMGWTLIPDGYPVGTTDGSGALTRGLRRLLKNLHLHYKRRYTCVGIRELLREFGVHADVIDRRLFVRGFLGKRGVSKPLTTWIRVKYVEPFETPRRTHVRGWVGHTSVYRTGLIVTRPFIEALCEWSRPAGTNQLVDFVAFEPVARLAAELYTQPVFIDEPKPTDQGQNVFEPDESFDSQQAHTQN